jgi:2-dehydro-3-deoxyglucarate aldolase/4-hydroxy-2-oxoheptanedioate aldolase
MVAAHLPSSEFKARLKAGEALGCHWLSLGAPALAELAAEAAPDAVVIDMQHGLWGRAALEGAIGGTAGRCAALVRTADQSPAAIGQALDAGALGVIAPLVNNAAECASVVAAAHYPPRGVRSAGGVRTMVDFAAYVEAAGANTFVAAMIETAAAVEVVKEIAATPGLDMIFIGPTDLALSMGCGPGSAAFEAALAAVLAVGRDAGVAVGMFTPSVDQALARAAQGFQLVVFVSDLELNRGHAKAQWERFKAGRHEAAKR